MNNYVGNEIKKYRLLKGYTQSELAKMLYISPQSLSKWEKNETSPNLEMVSNICEILGITPNDLLGFKQEEKSEIIQKKDIVNSNIKTFILTITLYIFGVVILYVGDMFINQVHPYNWIISIASWVFVILRMVFLFLDDLREFKKHPATKTEILVIFNNIFFTVLCFPFLIIYLFMDSVQMITQTVSWSIWYSQHIITSIIILFFISIYILFNIIIHKKFQNNKIPNKKSRI